MGLGTLPDIARELMAHGRAASTPVAVIERGTTARQRVILGTLSDIDRRIVEEEVESPSLVIVGEVVALRERLDWFARLRT
jgi:siroheme synthase